MKKHPTAEQILHDFVIAYDKANTQQISVMRCSAQEHNHHLLVTSPNSRNDRYDNEVRQQFTTLAEILERTGFTLKPPEEFQPPAKEAKKDPAPPRTTQTPADMPKTKPLRHLKVVAGKVKNVAAEQVKIIAQKMAGPKEEIQPHHLCIATDAPGFKDALNALQEQTAELDARYNFRVEQHEDKRMNVTLDGMFKHLPKHPSPQVAVNTIKRMQRMTAQIEQRTADYAKECGVPEEILAIGGQHTQQLAARVQKEKDATFGSVLS